MNLHLAALLLLASSAPAAQDTFEIRPHDPDPPIPPDPNRPAAGCDWTPPRRQRQGRECPTCGEVYSLAGRACAADHREVKTRRVVLDRWGQPVRRRR